MLVHLTEPGETRRQQLGLDMHLNLRIMFIFSSFFFFFNLNPGLDREIEVKLPSSVAFSTDRVELC